MVRPSSTLLGMPWNYTIKYHVQAGTNETSHFFLTTKKGLSIPYRAAVEYKNSELSKL